jgi:hypothetical protein
MYGVDSRIHLDLMNTFKGLIDFYVEAMASLDCLVCCMLHDDGMGWT